MCVCVCVCVVFLQAEDGIRDLVRSRGLGDVYKRQPLADGPTIQHSTQVSLEGGTTLAGCLDMLRELRRRGVAAPVLLFGYVNPFLAYGLPALARDARAAGAQGFIVPDLPPEEAADFEAAAAAEGLALIYFLAPTSSPQRIEAVTTRARGFIYLVSVTGVTGARAKLHACLLYTSDAADERSSVDLGGRRIIKKKKQDADISKRKPSRENAPNCIITHY